MSFWTSPDMKILPKFRYSLNFGGIIWWVKTAQFPKLSQEVKESKQGFGGNTDYTPGTAKWQPITITFADVMIPKTPGVTTRQMSSQMFWFGIFNIIDDHFNSDGFYISQKAGVYNEGFEDKFLDNVFMEGKRYLSKIEINKHYGYQEDILTPDEKWILEKIFIGEIDFGGGDYSSDDLNEISINFVYNSARPEYSYEGAEEVFVPGIEKQNAKANKIKREVLKVNKTDSPKSKAKKARRRKKKSQ